METVGDVLKNEGIEQVLAHAPMAWRANVLQAAQELLKRMEYATGEDIRLYALEKGCGKPHHPNAWGGISHAIRQQGWWDETDRSQKARDPKQHSTRLPVWKSLLYMPAANEQQAGVSLTA